MLSGLANQPHVKSKIVDRGDLFAQVFTGHEQVSQVGLAVFGVHISVRHIVYHREIIGPLQVLDIDRALRCEQHSVARISGGHHAVEHIDAQRDVFQNIYRSAHAHKVSRLVLWQNIGHDLGHGIHFLRRFAHRKSANGIALLV